MTAPPSNRSRTGRSAARPSSPGQDLSNLRAAYAALDEGETGPIVDLLDPQVHLSGPEHGHLWWRSHRTWNGPAEVQAELARTAVATSGASQGEPRGCRGETTPIGGRFITEWRVVVPPGGTPETDRGRHGDFHEVVTFRDGKIVRLADYRSLATARAVATAAY